MSLPWPVCQPRLLEMKGSNGKNSVAAASAGRLKNNRKRTFFFKEDKLFCNKAYKMDMVVVSMHMAAQRADSCAWRHSGSRAQVFFAKKFLTQLPSPLPGL
jgi:hypothetical protein